MVNLTKREYFAAHAPFTMQDAHSRFEPIHGRLPTGKELMNTLKVLRYMYTDAMISENSGEEYQWREG